MILFCDTSALVKLCNVAMAAELNTRASAFSVGDRVTSNGKHAELVSVPVNLCAKVPDGVPDDAAAFTYIGRR